MNRQELHRVFANVQASDELKMAVLSVEEEKSKKGSALRVVRRIAACAAVLALLIGAMLFWPGETQTEDGRIIEAPGILKAYAYEVKDNKNVDFTKLDDYNLMNNEIEWDQNLWSPLLNYRGIAITPVVNEADFKDCTITFEVTTNRGELYGNYYNLEKYSGGMREARMGQSAVIENGETLYWEASEERGGDDFQYEQVSPDDGSIYINIVIKADTHIVGYAIIEIVPHEELGADVLTSKMIETVYFPKVDGEFQEIAAEYVHEEITQFKTN